MNLLRSFLFGALATLCLAGALFGQSAIAETPQSKSQNSHLVTIQNGSEYYAISADLIDYIYAADVGDGNFEVHVSTSVDLTGDSKEIMSTTMKKSSLDDFVREVNKYRN